MVVSLHILCNNFWDYTGRILMPKFGQSLVYSICMPFYSRVKFNLYQYSPFKFSLTQHCKIYVRNYFLSAIWIWLNFLNNIILLEKCKTASNWLQMCILWKFEWNLKQIWILEITRNVQCKTQIRIFLKAKIGNFVSTTIMLMEECF